jgi:hypothetical protein
MYEFAALIVTLGIILITHPLHYFFIELQKTPSTHLVVMESFGRNMCKLGCVCIIGGLWFILALKSI